MMKVKHIANTLLATIIVPLTTFASVITDWPGDRGSRKTQAPEIKVLQSWRMPDELMEISAMVFVDANHIACVEDNHGRIYLFNLTTKAVERKITFEEEGDFEGLAYVNGVYYILRSDGTLYEVSFAGTDKQSVKKYDLPFSTENDTESLFYDNVNNRLLIAVKEKDLTTPGTKGIYAFDLGTKKLNMKSVYVIDGVVENTGTDGKGKKKQGSKGSGGIKPSEFVVNAKTKELYILNGPRSQFLIADASGKIKHVIDLDKSLFPQPEGLCFSPSGELYLSSEGSKNGTGVMAKVEIR